jgi:hypothetical protein
VTYISEVLREQVKIRAKRQCEYCLLPDDLSFYPHEIDHVISVKHNGKTTFDNLCYACWRCNRYKGSDLGSFDPETGQFSFFYNPRTQVWHDHFQLQEAKILGKTPEGRTTVHLLKFNSKERLKERQKASSH